MLEHIKDIILTLDLIILSFVFSLYVWQFGKRQRSDKTIIALHNRNQYHRTQLSNLYKALNGEAPTDEELTREEFHQASIEVIRQLKNKPTQH